MCRTQYRDMVILINVTNADSKKRGYTCVAAALTRTDQRPQSISPRFASVNTTVVRRTSFVRRAEPQRLATFTVGIL